MDPLSVAENRPRIERVLALICSHLTSAPTPAPSCTFHTGSQPASSAAGIASTIEQIIEQEGVTSPLTVDTPEACQAKCQVSDDKAKAKKMENGQLLWLLDKKKCQNVLIINVGKICYFYLRRSTQVFDSSESRHFKTKLGDWGSFRQLN